MSRVSLLPHLAIAVLLALIGPHIAWGGMASLFVVLGLVGFRRLPITRPAQALWLVGVGFFFALVPPVALEGELTNAIGRQSLGDLPCMLGCGVVAMAGTMALFERPLGGFHSRVVNAMTVVALTAAGASRAGKIYPAVVVTAVGALIWGILRSDPGRLRLRQWPLARWLKVGGTLGVGAILSLSVAKGLPILHDWAVGRFQPRFRAMTGFGHHLRLGALSGMLQSNKVVFRTYGPTGDLLRGAVYSDYLWGRWKLLAPHPKELNVPKQPLGFRRPTRVEYVHKHPPFYFTPLGSERVAASEGQVVRMTGGVWGPFPGKSSRVVWYDSPKPTVRKDTPRPGDTFLDNRLRTQLMPLVERWNRGSKSKRETMERFARALRKNYRYSLRHEQSGRLDPVLHFLYIQRQGHCEYFASALAVLGRAAKIPTRVVGGYRVTEYNSQGNYYIVREKNAHAWTEAYLGPEAGWVTFDATPVAELEAHSVRRSSWLAGSLDQLKRGFSKLRDWLLQDTVNKGALVVGVLAVVYVVAWLWRKRREWAEARAKALLAPAGPPSWFEDFEARLAGLGFARGASEALTGYIDRLAEAAKQGQEPALSGAVTALRAYGAWRYGDIGSEEEVRAQVSAWLSSGKQRFG